eukprot:TRINITY_DN21779_c0_g1_i1.p2 TRINITY_DN21779_c0_g1~~TRINITY_DN21779_c0_g1_i1.p2  ORF type:complete len:119 (-),score=18.15 TRINITY_DN21779_c0_g1_i1:116-472(-)
MCIRDRSYNKQLFQIPLYKKSNADSATIRSKLPLHKPKTNFSLVLTQKPFHKHESKVHHLSEPINGGRNTSIQLHRLMQECDTVQGNCMRTMSKVLKIRSQLENRVSSIEIALKKQLG